MICKAAFREIYRLREQEGQNEEEKALSEKMLAAAYHGDYSVWVDREDISPQMKMTLKSHGFTYSQNDYGYEIFFVWAGKLRVCYDGGAVPVIAEFGPKIPKGVHGSCEIKDGRPV